MTAMRETVAVHPATVSAVTPDTPARRKRSVTTERARSSRVRLASVHPDVMREALRLAGGVAARLVIHSTECVVVANHPRGQR